MHATGARTAASRLFVPMPSDTTDRSVNKRFDSAAAELARRGFELHRLACGSCLIVRRCDLTTVERFVAEIAR